MSWFNDLKVSKKIGLGFCAVLAMTFALGATALLKLDHVRGDVELMATDRLPTVKVLYSMQSDVQDLRRKEMGLLLDYPANEDAWKEKFAKIRQQLDEDEKTYLPMMTSEEEKALFQTFRTNLDKYEEFRKKEIAMAEAGHQREAATVALGEGLEVFEGMSKPLMQNVDLNTKDADRSAADAMEQYKQARTWTIVMLAAALGLGLVLSVVITRSIARPVSETMAVLESLAARDLTHTAEVKSKDELGAMGGALNRTIEALRDTLATISAGAQQLAGATQQLSAGASETAERSRSQADQTRQAATAMLEMTSTVQQISENSQQASDASKRAADAARSGGSVVEETLATMRTISESTAKVSSTVAELGKSSEQIGMIISVINDIADQTNLLALNAAIEAARAGEQGRGFAVVADEVRKLAERTTTATKEIATMIASIQNETGTAVRAMELSNRGVEQGLEKTSASGVALQEIIHVSEHVGDMIMQIATAATQQAAATEQVNSNVSQISESNEQSLQATEEAAKACVDLSKLAHDLERTVAQFKLEESGQGNYTKRMPGRAMAAAAHA